MPKTAPSISRDLLDYLAEVFPDKLPETGCPEGRLGELIGQQKVIRHLKAQFAEQQKDAMPKVL